MKPLPNGSPIIAHCVCGTALMLGSLCFGKGSQRLELRERQTKERRMFHRHCTDRSRPGRSQLGRVYHGSRVRGGHNSSSLIVLIDAHFAGELLRIAPAILEIAAEQRLIAHYRIAGQIRFDPVDLDRWVRQHRIDEFTPPDVGRNREVPAG